MEKEETAASVMTSATAVTDNSHLCPRARLCLPLSRKARKLSKLITQCAERGPPHLKDPCCIKSSIRYQLPQLEQLQSLQKTNEQLIKDNKNMEMSKSKIRSFEIDLKT